MTRKRLTAGALALAAALLMGVAVVAQHAGPHGPGGPMHGPGGPEGHHGGPLGPLARELNLTDAQKAQIKTLVDAFHEKMKAAHDQAGKAGDGPFEGLSDNFDEAAVRAAAQARAATHVELEVAHAKLMSQVYALLTAEQKAKVAELKQKFEQHRQQQPPPPPGEGGEN